MAKKRGNLASSLNKLQFEDQQRKTKKQKLENKQKHYPTNGKKPKKERPSEEEEEYDEKKVFVPFNVNDTILVVGDGDFSYSINIVTKGLVKSENLITSSYDSLDQLYEKYGKELIDKNLDQLSSLGVKKVFHEIDGTKLIESFKLTGSGNKRTGNGSGKTLNVLGTLNINNIVFNFPHIGKRISDVERNIQANQLLIGNFYKSCIQFYEMLDRQKVGQKEEKIEQDEEEYDEEGNLIYRFKEEIKQDKNIITVTVFEGEPYDSWKIKKLAKDTIGYAVQRSGKFEWRFFDDYHHRRTAGLGETKKVSRTRRARIYKFEKWVKCNGD